MDKSDLILRGSQTAKAGFKNEDDIADKFRNWKVDIDAQKWLEIMNYNLDEIKDVIVIKLHREKADIQVKILVLLQEAVGIENISIKLVSNPTGFNQIDKRWVKNYVTLWDIPNDVESILKLYTGEIPPNKAGIKDNRRMFFTEMSVIDQNKIIDFFSSNKVLVISDIFKGRGAFSASWMLVALNYNNEIKWALKSINHVLNIFSKGEVEITKAGNLKIGQIGMQRKGGDNGRASACMLQFKANPLLIFLS